MPSPSPVAVLGLLGQGTLTGVTEISAGGGHTCAVIGASDQALCWGENDDGQLGNGASGANVDEDSPVAVKGVTVNSVTPNTLTGVTEISAGGFHTCAVVGASTKQALCWGGNGFGQLGNGAFAGSPSPVAVRGVSAGTMLTNVDEISAGGFHSCAMASGRALCWGRDQHGQLGAGPTSTGHSSPVAVWAMGGGSGSTLTGVTAISAGDEHTCAVVGASDQALCWGRNQHGQLGAGPTSTGNSSPVAVWAMGGGSGSTLTGVTAISAGSFHTCAVVSGQALCWGENDDGQLGNGTKTGRTPSQTFREDPVAVLALGGAANTTLTGVITIAAGEKHTCALASGQALCWGSGGRLGNGMTADSPSPVQVSTP